MWFREGREELKKPQEKKNENERTDVGNGRGGEKFNERKRPEKKVSGTLQPECARRKESWRSVGYHVGTFPPRMLIKVRGGGKQEGQLDQEKKRAEKVGGGEVAVR